MTSLLGRNGTPILLPNGETRPDHASSGRRRRMGLYKRHQVWWMSVMYQGRQVRRSTGTTDRRLAEAILAKVRVQIVEGQFFETREEQSRTFEELMERYLKGPALFFSGLEELPLDDLHAHLRQDRFCEASVGRAGGSPDLPTLIHHTHPPDLMSFIEPHPSPPS